MSGDLLLLHLLLHSVPTLRSDDRLLWRTTGRLFGTSASGWPLCISVISWRPPIVTHYFRRLCTRIPRFCFRRLRSPTSVSRPDAYCFRTNRLIPPTRLQAAVYIHAAPSPRTSARQKQIRRAHIRTPSMLHTSYTVIHY